MAKLETVITAGIKEYTGEKVASVFLEADKGVENTYGIRVKMEAGNTIDFLLVGGQTKLARCTATQIADMLEECSFRTWPPESDV